MTSRRPKKQTSFAKHPAAAMKQPAPPKISAERKKTLAQLGQAKWFIAFAPGLIRYEGLTTDEDFLIYVAHYVFKDMQNPHYKEIVAAIQAQRQKLAAEEAKQRAQAESDLDDLETFLDEDTADTEDEDEDFESSDNDDEKLEESPEDELARLRAKLASLEKLDQQSHQIKHTSSGKSLDKTDSNE